MWDFGGVITTSPFEAFARYERERGLPDGFIRGLNSTNADHNAWAKLERSQVDVAEFCRLYEDEARTAGHEIDAQEVLACLAGDVRPEMVRALRRIRDHGLTQACLTNNFTPRERRPAIGPAGPIYEVFDHVIESSVVGVRKPDPEFYRIALDTVGIEPPEAVFLDDLGVNLKPARALGMTTIKVLDGQQALGELSDVLGIRLQA